jgi:hypothetical protein
MSEPTYVATPGGLPASADWSIGVRVRPAHQASSPSAGQVLLALGCLAGGAILAAKVLGGSAEFEVCADLPEDPDGPLDALGTRQALVALPSFQPLAPSPAGYLAR